MTITVDTSTESVRTGTTSPQTFSHAAAGSGVKGVVLAIVHGTSSTDHVSAASYGGVAMVRKQRNTDTATEAGAAELWFLGASIPQGTQTVSYTPGATTDDIHAVCITLLAARDTCVIDVDGINENATNPSVTLNYNGQSSMAFAALYGGGAAPTSFTQNGNCTSVQDHDLGAFYSEVIRQTTAGTADFAIGGTAGADDVAFAAMAVSEVLATTIDAGALTIAGQTAVVELSEIGQGGDASPLPHLGLLLADAGADLGVTIDAGALTVAGQSATVALGVATGGGALTIAGQSLTLSTGVALSAGALALDGQTITTDLAADFSIEIDAGGITLAGQSLAVSFDVATGGGAVTLSGQTLTTDLTEGLFVGIDSGALTISGQAATFGLGVATGGGALTLAGQAIEVGGLPGQGGDPAPLPHLGLLLQDSGNLGVTIDASSLTLAGQAISFVWSVPWTEGGITLTGQAMTVSVNTALSAGALTIDGQTVGTALGNDLSLEIDTAGALTLAGQAFTASVGVALDAGALTIAGQTVQALLSGNLGVDIDAGALTLDGQTLDAVLSEAVAVEQPSGGWAAYNAYDLERRKRRLKELEDEDEADRLEALLIAEGQLPQNPVIDDRITVREYALQADFSRRTQRAIDYALRARTNLAYQLAAREIANQLEDEEYAILLLLTSL